MSKFALMAIMTFLFVAVCFAVLMALRHIWAISQGQRRFRPKHGKISLYHIRDLIMRDEEELAIRMYIELYKVGYSQARKEVGELKKSIEEKKRHNVD